MEPATIGSRPGFISPVTTVVFNVPLSKEEKEHARLTSRVNFTELVWIADIMNKTFCFYKEAVIELHRRRKEATA